MSPPAPYAAYGGGPPSTNWDDYSNAVAVALNGVKGSSPMVLLSFPFVSASVPTSAGTKKVMALQLVFPVITAPYTFTSGSLFARNFDFVAFAASTLLVNDFPVGSDYNLVVTNSAFVPKSGASGVTCVSQASSEFLYNIPRTTLRSKAFDAPGGDFSAPPMPFSVVPGDRIIMQWGGVYEPPRVNNSQIISIGEALPDVPANESTVGDGSPWIDVTTDVDIFGGVGAPSTSCVAITGAIINQPITPVTYTGTGGAGAPYTFSATGLPTGLLMSSGGTISGIPTAFGSFTYQVTVTDSGMNSATIPCTMSVIGPPSLVCMPIVAVLGVPITPVVYVGTGGGGVPYTYHAVGLPPGLAITETSDAPPPPAAPLIGVAGTISGTPTAAGVFPYTVTVTDAVGNSTTINCSVSVGVSLANVRIALFGVKRSKKGIVSQPPELTEFCEPKIKKPV